jgi:hypothetical protein
MLSFPLGDELLSLIFKDMLLAANVCFEESCYIVCSILSDIKRLIYYIIVHTF